MHIGAIVTVAPSQDESSQGNRRALAQYDVLGASIYNRTAANLRKVGVLPARVIVDDYSSSRLVPSHNDKPNSYVNAWEHAVGEFVRNGADHLLLLRLEMYTELDYSRLIQFHLEKRSALTQVHSAVGLLDVAVVDSSRLREATGTYRRALTSTLNNQSRFEYAGYLRRLRNLFDLHALVEDSLTQKCLLSPVGQEIRAGVWAGADASIDQTARVIGPVYVGTRARIGALCTVAGPSSIEKNCEIDCGTSVCNSLVMQDTYVGAALDLTRKIACENCLASIERNVEVPVEDGRLIGRRRQPLVRLASLLRGEAVEKTFGVHES